MQAYLGGQPVNLTIPLPENAQSVSYRVIDQSEAELVAKTLLSTFSSGDDLALISLSGELNQLALGELRALRVVELYVVTDTGTIKLESGYYIEAEEVLVDGVNSFQSYNGAMFLSYEIPNLQAWNVATRNDRITALLAARRNIGKLRFRYVFDACQNIVDNTVGIADLTLATKEQWEAMPQDFRAAIRRAQILEADFLLGGDEIGDIRRSGLMSMSVGEAKQFFRPSKAIERAVCARAVKELSKFILSRTRIGRIG